MKIMTNNEFIKTSYTIDGVVYTSLQFAEPHWITKSLKERWAEIIPEQVEIPLSKIVDFEDLIEEHMYDGLYYYLTCCYNEERLYITAMNWILGPIAETLKEQKLQTFKDICSAANLRIFLLAMLDNKFNKTQAKEAFKEFCLTQNIDTVINNDKFKIEDTSIIDEIINNVISQNSQQFENAKKDPKLVNWLIGQVMKNSKGKANAEDVKNKLTDRLSHE